MNEHHEYLELIVQNDTSGNIDEVAIVLGKNSCTFGIVGEGASAGHLGWQQPVGTNAVVQWTETGGIKREIAVDISTAYTPEKPGQLTFAITGARVTVKFKSIDK